MSKSQLIVRQSFKKSQQKNRVKLTQLQRLKSRISLAGQFGERLAWLGHKMPERVKFIFVTFLIQFVKRRFFGAGLVVFFACINQ